MNKRDSILALLALGAAPFASHAQQLEKLRRIGVLIGFAESSPRAQLQLVAFKEALAALGWVEGRELTIDVRWSSGNVDRAAGFAKELVSLKPEVILVSGTPSTTAIQRETRTIPIVFTLVSDPVGSGFVKSLSHPDGNLTGLINYESSLAGKWLEILKEIAPRITRVAAIFNPKTAPYAEYYLETLRAAAPRFHVKTFAAPVASDADIERVISRLGRERRTGLVVIPDSFLNVYHNSVISLTARYKLPTISSTNSNTEDGGLVSYGVDPLDLFRRAASYVDRILRGAKPSELPVELPTKFELVINLNTAKTLGIKVPQTLLARADRVIE